MKTDMLDCSTQQEQPRQGSTSSYGSRHSAQAPLTAAGSRGNWLPGSMSQTGKRLLHLGLCLLLFCTLLPALAGCSDPTGLFGSSTSSSSSGSGNGKQHTTQPSSSSSHSGQHSNDSGGGHKP